MKAAVWYGEKDIRVQERQLKELSSDDVKVKVAWAGICGSDLHAYLHPDSVPMERGTVLGHEFSGVVEEVGSDVTELKKGDRVCIYPMMFENQENALYERFVTLDAVGAQIDGGFAEYTIIPQNSVFKVPEELSLERAALVEPASVAYQAVKDAGIEEGDIVTVYGAGPIGLFSIAAAKAQGAKQVIAIDIAEERLKIAEAMGADTTIDSTKTNPVETIRKMYPEGADVSIEAAGVADTFTQSIQSTRVRGTVMIVSFHTQSLEFNVPQNLLFTGVNIMGSVGYGNDTYNQVMNELASGALASEPIITSKITLDHIKEDGFEKLIQDKSQEKILIQLNTID